VSRIPPFDRDGLDEPQSQLYGAIVGARNSGAVGAVLLVDANGHLGGPFNAMLLNPGLGMALQELGTAIRYRGALTPRCREIAILAVAAHRSCEFELEAHTVIGERVGLSAAETAALRDEKPLHLPDAEESAVLAVTRTLVQTADLAQADYDAAVEILGPAKLFELTTLVGYYSLLALQMRAFGVSRPPGRPGSEERP